MAEGTYCASEVFCPSIAEFLNTTDVFENTEDDELEEFFASIPLEVLQGDTATPTSPPPISSTLCLPGPSNAHELQRLKDKNRNKNTDRSTNNWARRFETWQKQRGITVQLCEASASELDMVLQNFFAELKKKDGTDYEPESLRTMLAALDRFFRSSGCKYSIAKDKEFIESRKVLNGKAIELREHGKGKRKNRADPLTEEEEELLWEKGVLGDANPVSLNHTVFYVLSQHFGTRGRQEHHQIRVEELKFVKNAVTGEADYVEWVEGVTKTRQGGLVKKERRVPQQAYATGGIRCPVRLLKKLVSKRPENMKMSGPLYLTPLRSFQADREVWYATTPVGVNTINNYMKSMANAAGLDGTGKRLTNHSVRKTTVRKLQKQGIPNSDIAAITGHRNVQSLQQYAEMEQENHAQISKALSSGSQCAVARPPLRDCNPNMQTTPSFATPIVPHQYNFSNCTVFFGNTQASSTSTQCEAVVTSRKRPRAYIIDSDED